MWHRVTSDQPPADQIGAMLTSLTLLNYVQVDTEEEMLGYGIGIILLNIGMYFVAPAAVIIVITNRLRQ